MQISAAWVFVLIPVGLLASAPAEAQKELAQSPRILMAKTVYFNNQTGSDSVGKNTLAELKKWGKFRVVDDPKQADLVFFLSASPYKGGNIIFACGGTGSVDAQGNVEKDRTPTYLKQSPTRYAYLTVIDGKTGDGLWSGSHIWGGLLTGFNSVGERLVKELEKQSKK
jgi:hypothetical protein